MPALPSAPLVAPPPPIPGYDILASEVSRPHYNLRPDSRLLLDCNTSLPLLVVLLGIECACFIATYSLSLSIYPPSSFLSPGIFKLLPARSLSTTRASKRPSARCSPPRPPEIKFPPRSSPYTPQRPNSSHLRYRNNIPWHCCRKDQLRPLSTTSLETTSLHLHRVAPPRN